MKPLRESEPFAHFTWTLHDTLLTEVNRLSLEHQIHFSAQDDKLWQYWPIRIQNNSRFSNSGLSAKSFP